METGNRDPVWEEALELISQQVNEGTFRIWFEPTVGLGLADGTYSVGVASDFAKDWIDSRFRNLMSDAVSQVLGEPARLDIVVSPTLSRAAAQEGALAAESSSNQDPRSLGGPPGYALRRCISPRDRPGRATRTWSRPAA